MTIRKYICRRVNIEAEHKDRYREKEKLKIRTMAWLKPNENRQGNHRSCNKVRGKVEKYR